MGKKLERIFVNFIRKKKPISDARKTAFAGHGQKDWLIGQREATHVRTVGANVMPAHIFESQKVELKEIYS